MSEKEVHYDGYSSEIIIKLYNDSIKNKYKSIKKYLEYRTLKKYDTLFSEYQRLHDILSLYRKVLEESRSIGYSIAIKKRMYEIASQIAKVYNVLAELEESESIQTLLNKTIHPNINIYRNFKQYDSKSLRIHEDFLYLEDKFTSLEITLMGKNN